MFYIFFKLSQLLLKSDKFKVSKTQITKEKIGWLTIKNDGMLDRLPEINFEPVFYAKPVLKIGFIL